MSERLDELEALAQQRAQGEITDEQFAAQKALLFSPLPAEPESLSDEEVQIVWQRILGIIGLVLAFLLWHYNGWAIAHEVTLFGLGTEYGFFLGPLDGAYAVFIKVGSSWIGIARTNVQAVLIDAPMINVVGLVAALVCFWEGLKALLSRKPLVFTDGS